LARLHLEFVDKVVEESANFWVDKLKLAHLQQSWPRAFAGTGAQGNSEICSIDRIRVI